MLAGMNVQPGGDPSQLAGHYALHEELSKLVHPACPDVNWEWVEYQCLSLIKENGVDLYCAAALGLARTKRQGLQGLKTSIASLHRQLSQHSAWLWPRPLQARRQTLNWLFAQLQPLVRGLDLIASDLELLSQVYSDLLRLTDLTAREGLLPLPNLEIFLQQMSKLIKGLERKVPPHETVLQVPHVTTSSAPCQVEPITPHTSNLVLVTLERPSTSESSPQLKPASESSLSLFLLVVSLSLIGLGALTGWGWQ